MSGLPPITDTAPTHCPGCGSRLARRVDAASLELVHWKSVTGFDTPEEVRDDFERGRNLRARLETELREARRPWFSRLFHVRRGDA